MTREEKLQLLRELCLEFGPTGCESRVADLIKARLDKLNVEYKTDKLGNLIARIPKENAPRLMMSAHMDEVGFIINEITEDGYLKFMTVGGIDPRVLCSKHVTVEGKNGLIPGVIASKAIHHQTAEERGKLTPIESMYIDIGAKSREDAESMTGMGYYATFDSEFVVFGENKDFIKSKAIDDRLGCAVMLDIIERLGEDVPYDLYFCFTVREEIGVSGARTVAQTIDPDFAVILESTAVADLPNVPESRRVAKLGQGGAISLMDNSTIYNKEFVRFAMDLAKEKGIAAQIKQYVSGGNDAGVIHKSNDGVRTLTISAPSRYIHSPANVVSAEDYFSIAELALAIVENGNDL